MIYMGDEYGHTKGGNNNTYCRDNYVTYNYSLFILLHSRSCSLLTKFQYLSFSHLISADKLLPVGQEGGILIWLVPFLPPNDQISPVSITEASIYSLDFAVHVSSLKHLLYTMDCSDCESLCLDDFPTAQKLQWHGHQPAVPDWSTTSRSVAFSLVLLLLTTKNIYPIQC